MKFLSTTFIILIGLVCLTQITLSENCIEYEYPIYKHKTKIVPCPRVSTNDKRQAQPQPDNMFMVDFSCLITDQTLCGKVKDVFATAGKFITATLDLKSPIRVSAKFLDLCQSFGECDKERLILGAAGPARMIPFPDSDNKIRLYPQAIYKQLNLPEHPEFGPNEIEAMFNSNADYWFEGDPLPMSFRQADLLYVVLHELVHGLGFVNFWNDYLDIQALTPIIGTVMKAPPPGTPITPGTLPPTAKRIFIESVFDKFLVLSNGQSLTFIADDLSNFQINADFSATQIKNAFVASPQFPIAQGVYKNATTHAAMSFLLNPETPVKVTKIIDDIILETSLDPFSHGSSIAHVDFQTYNTTGDFLMMYRYPPGRTLGEMMFKANTTDTTGPIGPKLRLVLASLGYTIKTEYIAPIKLATGLQSNTTDTTNTSNPDNKNEKSDSSFVSFNLELFLFCILLLTFYI